MYIYIHVYIYVYCIDKQKDTLIHYLKSRWGASTSRFICGFFKRPVPFRWWLWYTEVCKQKNKQSFKKNRDVIVSHLNYLAKYQK